MLMTKAAEENEAKCYFSDDSLNNMGEGLTINHEFQ